MNAAVAKTLASTPAYNTGSGVERPGAGIPKCSDPIIAGTFTVKDTIGELLAAATALERIGYEPKIKFAGNGDDPSYIQLIVDDVADMMTRLRASLTSTNHKEGREG